MCVSLVSSCFVVETVPKIQQNDTITGGYGGRDSPTPTIPT